MSKTIETLIAQILDKDFTSANATFDALMNERIAVEMDEQEKIIAAKIYNDIDLEDNVAEAKKDDEEDDEDEEDDSDSDDENEDDDEDEEPKSKKKMKEDTKLDELSGATLGSYYVKAKKSRDDSKEKAQSVFKRGMKAKDVMKAQDTYNKHSDTYNKRQKGMNKAMDKLTGSGFAKVHAK